MAGLTINVEKSKFCMKEVRYLGHVVGEGTIRTDPDKISAITDFPTPRSVKQVRRFLDLLKTNRKFIWTNEAQKSFEELKSILSTAPVLHSPDFTQPFFIHCDASKTGIGGVLVQKNTEGDEFPIAFMSKKLNQAQRNYSVTEQECLAAMLCIKKFRAYVEGHEFTVITDHASLKWLMSQTDLSTRLARWALKLQCYRFKIEHRKGSQNVVPDALSRTNTEDLSEIHWLSEVANTQGVFVDLNSEHFSSEEYKDLLRRVESNKNFTPDLKIIDGYLYRRTDHAVGDPLIDDLAWKLWIPPSMVPEVLRKHHDDPLSSHCGIVNNELADKLLIGYAEVNNAPSIPALPGDCWENWLGHHYCCQLPLSQGNTFFFNCFIYHKDYNPQLLQYVLCEIFQRENKIRYILAIESPEYRYKYDKDRPDYYCLQSFSLVYYPKCFSAITCPNTQRIYVIRRDDVIPKMRYRRALPEDNDDIVDLVDRDRPDVKQQLGEYYIAEELLSESTNSVLVITEISLITAGFIWLNGHVDILHLLQNYDLDAFGNLIKFNPKELFKEKQIIVNSIRRQPINKLFIHREIDEIFKNLNDDYSNPPSDDEDLQRNSSDESNVSDERQLECFEKLMKFVEKLKSYDFYVKLRKRRKNILYNISTENPNAALDAQSNVFVIHLFGLMQPHDHRRLFRYLLTGFAAFPQRNYCLLSISVAQPMTPMLFEMLKYFIPVTPRPGCKIDEHLFITHRSAIYGDITLYRVEPGDVEDIKRLLSDEVPTIMAMPRSTQQTRRSTIASRMLFSIAATDTSHLSIIADDEDQLQYDLRIVLAILENIFSDPFSKYQGFIIKCGDSTQAKTENVTTGFVILRSFNSNANLEKHFLLPKLAEEPTRNMAEIMILKLHPLFHFQADVVFRELARQSNCWHFYHFRPTLYHCLSNDLLKNMQPLEPRRNKKLWFERPQQEAELPSSQTKFSMPDFDIHPIDYAQDHFAAYQNNLSHSAYFGHTMNIVILGFTDICKAFLRLMIFSWQGMKNISDNCNCLPHVRITVICDPGVMEAEYENSFRCSSCENDADCWVNYRNCDAFVRDVTERMDLRNWVRFVSGKVKAIDTDNHLVKLESECEIYYETLLLMCHTEYGLPSGMITSEELPSNYIEINSRFDKLLFYHQLRFFQRDVSRSQCRIVVYGLHIRAFEFINFLIGHAVPGKSICLVMPHEMANLQMGLMLNDSSIDVRIEAILREMIEDLGVTIYERMNIEEIQYAGDGKIIKAVMFRSYLGEQKLLLNCDFFASYWEKYLSDEMQEVLEEAELDTEGQHILINENYQTSDRCVYAIGNFVKQRNEPNHQYRFVCPQEAAEKIIVALGLQANDANAKEEKFSKPYLFQAQLPMEFYFFKITTPKRYLANHLDNEYGFPLITYSNGDFSRVRLNEHGMVEEIVIVTKKNKDYDFLKFFCGRHELLLNNLRSRWYLKDIESFLDFFQEPWVELIMNDHFEELQMINKLLISPTAEQVMKMQNTDRTTRHKIMRSICQDLGITNQLECTALEFLRKHRCEFSTDIALPEDFPKPPTKTMTDF
ncbi:cilia- and flagella-associated protein 61-like [Musca vetustissima]|uniref:cilia- and flagella-associated protein 61-like n=1 Tax=Musca vetustissima TaxID=27455 RepID=UPI002AB78AD4|nr:cilia- and flagella-associated protein 61-like [Musca vetustissima]